MLKAFLNLFLQSNCPLCQRPTPEEFCLHCTRQLQKCHIEDCSYLWKNSLPVFAWGKYSGNLKRAIAVMKYENYPEIARPLGQWLGEAWLANSNHSLQKLIVVPIPLHPNKQKKRGYNQAALIAKSFCEITGLKFRQNGLLRLRETEAQFNLSSSEREKNLIDAFGIGKDLHRQNDTPILLIDDIYTTGATAKSAVKTLQKNGIAVSGLAAVAASSMEINPKNEKKIIK